MKQYLMVANGQEKMAREERVKISLRDLENDLMGHMTMLRLELPH